MAGRSIAAASFRVRKSPRFASSTAHWGKRSECTVRGCGLAFAVAAAALVLWGGYGHHWLWTGINGHTATLWDWLHLLMLPVAVGVLPIWLTRRSRLTRRHKSVGFGTVACFAVLVLAGYAIPWAWTGFTGNKLWDWLELLALPVAVALTPLNHELRVNWSRRDSLVVLTSLVVFVGIVLGGYLGGWSWTGFPGNTLWDWLHLLLLPLLIPTIIVPAVMPVATAGLTDEESDTARAHSEPLRSAAQTADPSEPSKASS